MKELVELKARAAERRNRPDYARGVHLSDAHCVEAEDDVDELIAMVKEWEHLYLSTVPTMNELGKQRDQARADVLKLRDALTILDTAYGSDVGVLRGWHAETDKARIDTEHYEQYR